MPNYDDDVFDELPEEIDTAELARFREWERAQQKLRSQDQLNMSQASGSEHLNRAQESADGPDPRREAVKVAEDVVARGGGTMDGLAAGIHVLLEAGARGDKRVILDHRGVKP